MASDDEQDVKSFFDDQASDSDDESGTASEDWEADSEDDAFLNDDEDFHEEAAPFSDPFQRKRLKEVRKREKEKDKEKEKRKQHEDDEKVLAQIMARREAAAAANRKAERLKARTIDSDSDGGGGGGGGGGGSGKDGRRSGSSSSSSSKKRAREVPTPKSRSSASSSSSSSSSAAAAAAAAAKSATKAARAKAAPPPKRRRLGGAAPSSSSSAGAGAGAGAKLTKEDLLLRAMPSIRKTSPAATTAKKPFRAVWAEAFQELKAAMASSVPRNFATNQQLVVLEQAGTPAQKDLQDALALIKKMKDWKTKESPHAAKHPALRKRMSNLYKFWKAIAQGKPARLAVYTRRRRVLGGGGGGAGARRAANKTPTGRKPAASTGSGARKKVLGRSAVASSRSGGGGGGGGGVVRKRVVVNKNAVAAGAHATSASLVEDGDKYTARLERIMGQPLGGQSKEAKLLETLRDLAKYKPDTAELNAAAALTAVIKKLSLSTKSSNVKQLATKRLTDWIKTAKMRDLKEGKQKRNTNKSPGAARPSGSGSGSTGAGSKRGGAGAGSESGPRNRARRSSLPPMRIFKDVCVEYDPGLKECISSAKPSLVASTLRSLTMLGKYRPKSTEIEAAVDTISSVKALRKHESARVRDESAKLYAQWKAVMKM